MTDPDEPDDDTTFIQLEGSGLPPLSRSAFQLHSFATVNSVQTGHPGFMTDDYLNSIAAETTITVAELEAAGMWARRDGGYFIVADQAVKWAIDYNEENEARFVVCEQRGAHVEDAEGEEAGWLICSDCGTPLKRPDGGPVALPNGGRLGLDHRYDDMDADDDE